MRRIFILGAVVGLAGIALAGCGGGDSSGMNGMDMGNGMGNGTTREKNAAVVSGAREIPVSAKAYEFTPNTITIKSGEDVTISLSSVDGFHDFMVQGIGHVVGAKAGKTAMGGLRVTKPGTYKFWCSVSGHRSNGMKGTITVT